MPEYSQAQLLPSALRGIFAALGSDALQKVIGLCATFIVLSALSPYTYGLWQLALSVLTIFDVLLASSIGTMLIADLSREIGAGAHERAGSIVVRAVPFFFVLGVTGAVLMVIAAPFISKFSGIDLTVPLWVLALSLIAEGISQGYHLILQGTLALAHAQFYKVLKRFWYAVGIIALLAFFKLGLIGIVWAYTLSIFMPVILYAPIVLPRYRALARHKSAGASPFLEAAWVRGRWSFMGDLVAAASASLWPWLIGYYLSVSQIGYISVATMAIGQVASIAPISFVLRSILPRTIHVEGRTRAWLARSMKYGIWSQIAGGLIVTLAAFALIPIFFPAYIPAIPIIAALILTLPVRAVGVVASEWFTTAKRQRSLFLLSSLPKVALLALLPVLLSLLGILGYVVWSLLSADVLTFLRLRLVSKEEGGRLSMKEIILPDREDSAIFGRILDSIYKMRYTRP